MIKKILTTLLSIFVIIPAFSKSFDDKIEKQIINLEKSINTENDRIENFSITIARLQKDKESLNNNLKEKDKTIKNLKNDLNDCFNKISQAINASTIFNENVKELNTKLEDSEKEKESFLIELTNKTSSLEFLKNQLNDRSKELTQAAALTSDYDKKFNELTTLLHSSEKDKEFLLTKIDDKHLSIKTLKTKLNSYSKKLSQSANLTSVYDKKIKNLTNQLASSEKENNSIVLKLNEKDDSINILKTKLDNCSKKLSQSANLTSVYDKKITTLTIQIEDSKKEKSSILSKINKKNVLINNLKIQLDIYAGKLSQYSNLVSNYDKKINELTVSLANSKKEKKNYLSKLNEKDASIKNLKTQLDGYSGKLLRSSDITSDNDKKIEKLYILLENTNKENETMVSKVEKKDVSINSLKKEIDKYSQELSQSLNLIHIAQNKIKELNVTLDNSKKEKDAFISKLDKKDITIQNLKRQLTYSKELSQSPNFTLTYDKKIEKISTLLDIAENEKKFLLTKLNEKNVSIKNLNTELEKYSSELSQSSILTSTSDKKINALIDTSEVLKKEKEDFISKLNEKDVSIKNLKTQLDGYSGKLLRSSDITSDNDKKIEKLYILLENTNKENETMVSKVEKKDVSINSLKKEIDKYSQELSQSLNLIHIAQNKIKELNVTLDNSKKEKDAFISKLDKKDITIQNLKRQLTYSKELSQSPNFTLTYDKKIEKISTLLDIAENEKKFLLTKLNEKNVSIKNLNTELEKYSSELSQSSILTSTSDKKINALIDTSEVLKKEKEDFISKLNEKDVSIKNLKTQLDGYSGKLLQSSDITSDYDKKIKDLSVCLEISESEKKFLLTKLAEKDASIKVLNSELDELSQKLSQSATISNNKLSELSGLLESFEKEKKNLLSELVTKNNSIKTLKTQFDELSKKIPQSDNSFIDNSEKIAELTAAILDKKRQIQTLESLLSKANIYKSKFASLELNYSKQLIELNESQSKIEINDKLISDKTSQINQLEKTIVSIKNQTVNMQKKSKDKPDINAKLTNQLSIKNSQLTNKNNSLNFIKTQLSANQKQIDIMKKESYDKNNIVSQLTKEISQLKKDKENLSLNLLEQNKKEEFLSDQLKEKDLKISRLKSIIEGTINHIESMSQSQPSN